MKFDVYGRFRLEVEREGDRWVAYKLDNGKRLVQRGLIIPPTFEPSEIATYLDDLFHEMAKPGEYRLKSTGEVVEDPDYTCTWSVTPRKENP